MSNIQDYLTLPYTVILRRDEEGHFIAKIEELSGCVAHGMTPADAIASLNEAQELWISDAIEAGDPIPQPRFDDDLPSGKWLQRTSRTLHRKLIDLAKRENVSLNQLVTSILAEAVGLRSAAGYSLPLKGAYDAEPQLLPFHDEHQLKHWSSPTQVRASHYWDWTADAQWHLCDFSQKPFSYLMVVPQAICLMSSKIPGEIRDFEETKSAKTEKGRDQHGW